MPNAGRRSSRSRANTQTGTIEAATNMAWATSSPFDSAPIHDTGASSATSGWKWSPRRLPPPLSVDSGVSKFP